MHLQGKSFVQVVLKTPRLELGLKMRCPVTVTATRCSLMVLLPGELWKDSWGTLGSCGFLQVCGGQAAAWMGLDGQHCHHPCLAARGFEFSAETHANHQFCQAPQPVCCSLSQLSQFTVLCVSNYPHIFSGSTASQCQCDKQRKSSRERDGNFPVCVLNIKKK